MTHTIADPARALAATAPNYTGITAEDQARLAFLQTLQDARHVELSLWEVGFLSDLLKSPRPLCPGQRRCIDSMINHYTDLI